MGSWDIYYGMMQFMVLQLIGLVLIIIFPKIAQGCQLSYMDSKKLKFYIV